MLYEGLVSLQVALTRHETLAVVGVTLAVAACAGALAAFGAAWLRVLVFAVVAAAMLDVSLHLPGAIVRATRSNTAAESAIARDSRRVADLHRIKTALGRYAVGHGTLPRPVDYGEATGSPELSDDWWDLSSEDLDRDGQRFLSFLVESGAMSAVPVDPLNEPALDGAPTGGRHYAYLVIPAGYQYRGGVCAASQDAAMYLLAVTDLETEASRPPQQFTRSGCDCLWRDDPGFFDRQFDYVLCGTVPPAIEPDLPPATEVP